MTNTETKLSPAMLECLNWIDSIDGVKCHRVFSSGMGYKCPTSRATLKALQERGILKYRGGTEWRHGVGNAVAYQMTTKCWHLIIARRLTIALGRLSA